jgi:hypothetical protein
MSNASCVFWTHGLNVKKRTCAFITEIQSKHARINAGARGIPFKNKNKILKNQNKMEKKSDLLNSFIYIFSAFEKNGIFRLYLLDISLFPPG